MHPHLFRALVVVGMVSAAMSAGAQTESVPILVLDPPDIGQTEESETADAVQTITGAEQTRPSQFEYSIGAGGGWESDVGLLVSTQGESDYSGSAFLDLSWMAFRPRSRIRLIGGLSGTLYAEQTEYNRWEGDAAFAVSRRLSRRFTGALGLAVGNGYTDSSRILSDQGLILPLTRTIDYAGNLGLDVNLSQTSDLRISGRAYRVDFPESEVFQDSTSLRLTASLDRRLGQRDTLTAEYSSEAADRVEGESLTYWTHYFSGIWARVLTRDTTLRARVGASHTPPLTEDGTAQWRFYGGLSLGRTIRGSTLSASYTREVLPVFGLEGIRFADRFSLGLGVPMGEDWRMDLSGYYMVDAEATEGGDRASSTDGSAGLSARLSRRLWLSARGRYYRRSSVGDVEPLENYRVGMFLVFGTGPGTALRY